MSSPEKDRGESAAAGGGKPAGARLNAPMHTQSESTESSPPAPSARVEPGLLGTFDHLAQQRELGEQLDRLRAERDRLLDRQRQIAELLQSKNPDKLLHDLRNVLNELQ